jgi:inorganic pyrophosphatase
METSRQQAKGAPQAGEELDHYLVVGVEEVAAGAVAQGAQIGVRRMEDLGKEDRSGFMASIEEIEASQAQGG